MEGEIDGEAVDQLLSHHELTNHGTQHGAELVSKKRKTLLPVCGSSQTL